MAGEAPAIGTFGWHDLTVPNADGVRDFYEGVLGWTHDTFDMGGYGDYVMKAPDGTPVGGVCHAKGVNAKVPPVWLIYVMVADIKASVEKAKKLGGQVVDGPRKAGSGTMCIVRDPAGAAFGLYQS